MKQKRSAWIALRRKGIMLQKQPAAGGESCIAGFFFILLGNEICHESDLSQAENPALWDFISLGEIHGKD